MRWLPLFLMLACADPTPSEVPDAGSAAVDASQVDAGAPDAGPQYSRRALLLDFDLLPAEAWFDLEAALNDADIALDYRRLQPHLLDGDARYELIIIAAGSAPDTAAELMAPSDVEVALRLLSEGRQLLLATAPVYGDVPGGQNDWFFFNRLLERAEAGIRVDLGHVIGVPYIGRFPVPHVDTPAGYATPLELDFGYPWLQPAPIAVAYPEAYPGGSMAPLRVDPLRAEVHARVDSEVYLYPELGPGLIFPAGAPRVGVALSKVGDGVVAVMPRSVLTIGAANDQVSIQPALSVEAMEDARMAVRHLLLRLDAVAAGDLPILRAGDEPPLFSTAADGHPPLQTEEVLTVPVRPRETSPLPPREELLAPKLTAATLGRASWLSEGPMVIAYGDAPGDPEIAARRFAEAKALGFSAYVATFVPERMLTYDVDGQARERARLTAIAEAAEAAQMPWFVGMYYSGFAYNAEPDRWPNARGPRGETLAAPSMAGEEIWAQALIPAVEAVAEIAASHPGIAGISIDMELYGTKPWYSEAHAFDDTTFETFLSLADENVAASLRNVPYAARFDHLLAEGHLGLYFDTLETWATQLGVSVRRAATERDPDFAFLVYTAQYPTGWFYRGFLAGLGTEASPVTVLTYEADARRTRARSNGRGVAMLHAGGFIAPNFAPEEAAQVLENLQARNDGAWLFSYDQITAFPEDTPLAHGARADYREAVRATLSR